jgi:hypothetical protein
MRKQWLPMAVVLAFLFGSVGVTGLLMQPAAAQNVVVDSGWRFSDGYWNYWDADDNAYYYTDGRHWYTYGNDAWSVYNFDKKFGNKYVREGYVAPKAGPDLVLPKHKVKVKVK